MTECQIQNARELYWLTQADDMQGAGSFTWDTEDYPCFTDFIRNGIQLDGGGFIQKYSASILVPRFSVDDTTLALTDLYPTGIPGEGAIVNFQGLPRRVVNVENYIPGEGFMMEIEGPDQS